MVDKLNQNIEIGDAVIFEEYSNYKGLTIGIIIGKTPQKIRIRNTHNIKHTKEFDMADIVGKEKQGKLKYPSEVVKINVDTLEAIS